MSKQLRSTQQAIQGISLILFLALLFTGKVQIWMVIFLIGLLITPLLGRVYCGWICPINTSMNLVSKVKNKLKIKSIKTPNFIKKSIVRYLMLSAFIITFIFIMVTGKKLPVLAILFITGILLTMFFPAELWHRYLCPYGTLLSFLGTKSKRSVVIFQDNCIKCGLCSKACPGVAISNSPGYIINKKDCLVCLDCVVKCPQNTISYN